MNDFTQGALVFTRRKCRNMTTRKCEFERPGAAHGAYVQKCRKSAMWWMHVCSWTEGCFCTLHRAELQKAWDDAYALEAVRARQAVAA